MKYLTAQTLLALIFFEVCVGFISMPDHQDDVQSYFKSNEYVNCILTRPTNESVTINVMSSYDIATYIQFGINPEQYEASTQLFDLKAHEPLDIDLTSLKPNTRYYYRMIVSDPSKQAYKAGAQATFVTAKTAGHSFKFAVLADSHFQEQPAFGFGDIYLNTLENILMSTPDFLIDMGDTFMANKLITQMPEEHRGEKEVYDLIHAHRAFYGTILHSIPMFSVRGNQDGEFGYELDTDAPVGLWAAKARRKFFPQPNPDYKFYDSNSQREPLLDDGWVEDYYSFRWGDALFIILDPYWYTRNHVHSAWDWTLGKIQYTWFMNTLKDNADAKHKFVLSHNIVGAQGSSQRGGAEWAHFYEWGGHEEDGRNVFRMRRPGWGGGLGVPIHDLMVKYKVDVFFHGHDHFFARQEVDGVVYQLCPKPDEKRMEPFENRGAHGYVRGIMLPGAGHLEVSVESNKVVVLYVKTFLPNEVLVGADWDGHVNREVEFAYSISRDEDGELEIVDLDGADSPEDVSFAS